MSRLAPFTGRLWRILFAERGAGALDPVQAREGRFHHGGQRALYASLSREGAGVAIARYVSPGDAARLIVPLEARFARVADRRGEAAASIVWQGIRAGGAAAPTWGFSDAARAEGAEAMLYSSRSRPALAHIVIFDWAPGLTLVQAGPAEAWPASP